VSGWGPQVLAANMEPVWTTLDLLGIPHTVGLGRLLPIIVTILLHKARLALCTPLVTHIESHHESLSSVLVTRAYMRSCAQQQIRTPSHVPSFVQARLKLHGALPDKRPIGREGGGVTNVYAPSQMQLWSS
jgi:hypothetical protein